MRILIVGRERAVAVEQGVIVEPEGRFDVVLDVPGSEIRPGLINAHDHLHRNHYGRLGAPPYRNACEWARDIQSRYQSRIDERHGWPRRTSLLIGAQKNLAAGVTTVVHHDPWEPNFDDGFPIRVARVRCADSLGMSQDLPRPEAGTPFMIHLAEGVDAASAAEVGRLDALGLLTPDLIAVHGVGMEDEGLARFLASGAALVWCPTSNVFLFGRTCPDALLCGGVDLLLGSDSLLTGAGNLLDELRFARSLGRVDDARLEGAVGATAARRLGLPIPTLEIGSPADLVVLSKPLLEARAEDVDLVLVGGTPRAGRSELISKLAATERDENRPTRETSDIPVSMTPAPA